MSTPLLSETPESFPEAEDQAGSSSRRWKVVAALSVLVVLSIGGAVVIGAMMVPERVERQTHIVTRGNLLVTVTEPGTLESSRNTEIKCEIRGGYGGRGGHSTVTWVIPAGSTVEEGDELVRLDTKVIEETVSLGKTDTNNAKAELAQAEADFAKAEIAVDAYLRGRFLAEMQRLQSDLEVAERNLQSSTTMLEKSEELFRKGYATESEVEVLGYTVIQAELDVNVVKTQIDVTSRLTKAMQLETLNGDREATEARVAGRKAGLELEQGRLDLAEIELGKCVIKAPRSGLVIYPSTARWKNTPDITEGASVRKDQVLLLMPDLTRMQVKIGIHESIIDRVEVGMPARIKFNERSLNTRVTSVASVSRPAGWWTGNIVRYDTTLELPIDDSLRPGMTVDVEVVIARHRDVLSVPVNAVLETEKGQYCWVETPQGPQRRDLKLGDSNEVFIVVEEGLDEGEQVILDPSMAVPDARALVAAAQTHEVASGPVRVTVTEQGTLESSNNTTIKCRVRGSSTINWVVENGTYVQPGDELVRLENKQIEDYLHERTKFALLSKDAAITARAEANRAELAIDAYLEGTYKTELMELEKQLAVAQSDLRSTENMLAHQKRMLENNYVSDLDVQNLEYDVHDGQANVESTQIQIDVLKRFTKREQLAQLRGDWSSLKASANGHEEVLKMDEQRIALAHEEMEQCVVRAERSGLVIYPEDEKWKDAPDIAEGSTVHKDQTLLLMPDLSQMQVKVGIHESVVDHIKPGMVAKVTLPEQVLEGKVVSVASVAERAGWWNGNIVKYDTIVELPSADGLKPGMSAEVEILISEHADVLRIPTAAVLETADGEFCWVGTAENAERRKLQLGDSSDTFVVVESGVKLGESVIVNPTGLLEEARELAPAHSDGSARPKKDDNIELPPPVPAETL